MTDQDKAALEALTGVFWGRVDPPDTARAILAGIRAGAIPTIPRESAAEVEALRAEYQRMTQMAYDEVYKGEDPSEREVRWKWILLGISQLRAERDTALSESLEQARLLGISGSRAARLMAEVAEVRRERDAALAAVRHNEAVYVRLEAELQADLSAALARAERAEALHKEAFGAAVDWQDRAEVMERDLEAARRDLAEEAEIISEISQQKPEKPDHWSSCGQCERNQRDAEYFIDRHPAPPTGKEPTNGNPP